MSEMAKQIADQCRVVEHLALQVAKVHGAFAKLYASDALPESVDSKGMWDVVGNDTALRMEVLGDMLNGMDAVDDDEDDWAASIFDAAHRLFPQEP